MSWFNRPRVPRKPVAQIASINDQKLAVVDLGRDVSVDVRRLMETGILERGEPFKSGGALGTSCLPLLGAGSAAASSLFAGNVFLATANPSTLMTIGQGVGSAVVNPATGVIVGQAPFIAASSAILPAVVPVMFFMTVSAMMMSVRFDHLQSSLDGLKDAVEDLLRREVAEDFGQVFGALTRLEDVAAEYQESRRFTPAMRIRLALIERDFSALHHKYEILVSGRPASDSAIEISMAPMDQYLYALSGVASIYVDRQRLRLALQDNPDDVDRRVKALTEKIGETRKGMAKLLDQENNPLKQVEKELRDSVEGMSWWESNISKRGRARKEASIQATNVRAERLEPVVLELQKWSDSLTEHEDEGLQQSVVYYREDNGKGDLKAYYTSDLRLQYA